MLGDEVDALLSLLGKIYIALDHYSPVLQHYLGANMVTHRGPTMVANTLHACAILLKKSKDWDWFINLSASDYPLVTQDEHQHQGVDFYAVNTDFQALLNSQAKNPLQSGELLTRGLGVRDTPNN